VDNLDIYIITSLGQYLCWWAISPRWYHPNTSQCVGTDVVYKIYLLLTFFISYTRQLEPVFISVWQRYPWLILVIVFRTFCFTCSKRLLDDFIFWSFDMGRTWWKFDKKLIVPTELDIYMCVPMLLVSLDCQFSLTFIYRCKTWSISWT
jgi:hypothetical protein